MIPEMEPIARNMEAMVKIQANNLNGKIMAAMGCFKNKRTWLRRTAQQFSKFLSIV